MSSTPFRRLGIALPFVLAFSMGGVSPVRAEESPWLVQPERSPYELFMAQGDSLALSATKNWPLNKRRAISLASLANDAYSKAIDVNPSAGDPHFRIAAVTHAFLTYHNNASPHHLLREEIQHYNQFEKKSPLDSRLETVVFRRSIARTKLGGKANLEAAVQDYDHHLELMDLSNINLYRSASQTHGNRAELLMMLGRLPEAIAGYERALAYRDNALSGYGLAVALDRDGQNTRARQVAAIYARNDSGNALMESGTFFVPQGEIFYYIAIKAESLGSPEMAAIAYRRFLELVPNSRYAPKAQANLKTLKKGTIRSKSKQRRFGQRADY